MLAADAFSQGAFADGTALDEARALLHIHQGARELRRLRTYLHIDI
jgi:hypothetical protein